jgi:hypothetical protein
MEELDQDEKGFGERLAYLPSLAEEEIIAGPCSLVYQTS